MIRSLALVRSMSRARIRADIDDAACAVVMGRHHRFTKQEAVILAVCILALEPLDLDQAHGLRGSGWEGDLYEPRIEGPR